MLANSDEKACEKGETCKNLAKACKIGEVRKNICKIL
jgi:hypothetical protein